jgi:hypothetical protein
MKEFLIIAASTALVYFLLLPIVGWYQKTKKEMEEHNDGGAE